MEPTAEPIVYSELPIVVAGSTLPEDAPKAYLNEDGVMMVPAQAVAEALGMDFVDAGDDLYIISNIIGFTVGQDAYTFAKLPPYELGTVPVIIDDVVYVPVEFFSVVAKQHNAEVTDTEIVINND